MNCSSVQTLDVEQGNRRVNQEAEYAGTDHVPEGNCYEAHQRPTQTFRPVGQMLVRPVFVSFTTQQNQRYNFQSGETCTDCHRSRGRAGEVQVVQCTWDTAQHEDGSSSQSRSSSSTTADKAHVVEDECEGGSSEHFEETFYPQVNHPPTPVFHHSDWRFFTVEQARSIEHTHTDHRSYEDSQQVFVCTFFFKGRDSTTQHQEQPQQQADHQQQLPEATQIQVFVTLVTEPEVQLRRNDVGQSKEVTCIRTADYDEQGDVQEVHTGTLEFRIFTAVHNRSQEQTCCQEAGCNPENSGLDVPSTGQCVWEPVGHFKAQGGIDTVETLTFDSIVSGQTTQQYLYDKQRNSQEYIFAQRFLRRSQLYFGNRILSRYFNLFVFGQERVTPHQQADTHQQQYHAGEGPHVVFSSRYVLDQRLVRPVVGVSEVLIRTVSRSRPRSPEEEVEQFFTRFLAWQCVVFHCKVFASGLELRIVAVHTVIVRQNTFDRFHAGIADNDRTVFLNTALVAVFVSQTGFQNSLFLRRNFVKFFAVSFLRSQIQPCNQLAVQPVGSPVRSLVCTVTQYRANFHTAGSLPCRLTCQNIVFGHQDFAGCRNDLFRVWRSLFIDLATHITKNGKAYCQYGKQQVPKLLVLSHFEYSLILVKSGWVLIHQI